MKKRLKEFNLSGTDLKQKLDNLSNRLFTIVKDLIKSKVQYLEIKMEKRFADHFKYDEHLLPRRWKPTDDIDKAFLESKSKGEALLEMFTILRLRPEDDSITLWNKETNSPTEIDEKLIILTYDEAQKLLERFKKDTEAMFTQAKHEQESVTTKTSIPTVVIVLVLILGFDEFMAVLSSPLLLIFWIFVGVIIYVLYLLNLTDQLFLAANQLLGQGLSFIQKQAFAQLTSKLMSAAAPSNTAAATPTKKNE